MNPLFDPFAFGFMLKAFAVATIVGAVCAVLSCFLVLRGWSLMGDAVSHAVLPGIVLANMAGLPLAVGAFASGLLCAFASGWIDAHTRLKEDTTMGVVFTGLFAFGLVLMSKHTSELHLDHILFGNILGLPQAQLMQTAALSIAVLIVFLALRRDFLLIAFDPAQAQALGRPVQRLNHLLLGLLALTIVAAMQAVGLLLVIAMLVTPGATAFLLARRFDDMLLKAVTVAVSSGLIGIYVSFFLDGSPAACIVVAQALVFIAALLFAPRRGLLRKTVAVSAC
ncbi:MAG: metal ABC transporter permease [Verrucomicrobia bacterium]|nr:metal ABC transporter permease [Verrucomicrobiota bacterium]